MKARLIVTAAVFALAALFCGAARATIVVTSASGDKNVVGDCVLRDAITYANTGVPTGGCGMPQIAPAPPQPEGTTSPGYNEIVLPSAVTITLAAIDDFDHATGLPAIAVPVWIKGNGSVIERDPALPCNHDGAATPGEFGLIYNTGALKIEYLTLRGGCADSSSGTGANGGAIHNVGQLLLDHVVLNGNFAYVGGGAVYSYGFAPGSGSVLLYASTFIDNSARSGGAAYLDTGASLLANDTLFEQNAAAEFFAAGALYVNIGATAAILNSTFAQNTAGSGSAIQADGFLDLSFVTVAENVAASGSGGAIQIGANGPIQRLRIANSIFAANTGGNGSCQFASGTVTLSGANLASDESCAGFDFAGSDAMLAPLANNGGATPTYALAPSSPAVDAAPGCTDASGGAVTNDQRERSRPQGSACDLGAYELEDVVFDSDFEFQAL